MYSEEPIQTLEKFNHSHRYRLSRFVHFTLKGRSHIRCTFLRCASKTQEAFYQRNNAQRSVRVNGP